MNDDDDLDEDIVTNKLRDELGLPPTEANIERVQRSLAFKIRMIDAKVAVVGASVAEKQHRFLREMRRRSGRYTRKVWDSNPW
jgi:hypothetical protein